LLVGPVAAGRVGDVIGSGIDRSVDRGRSGGGDRFRIAEHVFGDRAARGDAAARRRHAGAARHICGRASDPRAIVRR